MRLLLLALLAAAPLAAQPASLPDSARRALDAALDSATRDGFAGHVLVARGGATLYEGSRGATDGSGGTSVDSTTIFSIGSVTKQFTRAAILKLEEEGKLSLADSIVRFLPDLPADKRPITVGQLLDMRAGLHEYHDTPGDTVAGDHQRVSKEEALRRIGAQPLRFAPGTAREYSNSGYTLLAAIVERASGADFETYVRAAFLEPLGMTSTGFYGDRRWPAARFAVGAGPRTYGPVNAPHAWPRPSWVLTGAGGMVSTARDLQRFVAAMRGGRVLGPAALAKMHPREPAAYAGGNDFGFGTLVLELDGGRDVVIVTTHAGAPRMRLGLRVAELARGTPLPEELRTMFGGRAVAQGGPPGGPGGGAQGGPRPLPDTPQARTVRRFVRALQDGAPSALETAVRELFTPEMQAVVPMPQHVAMLGDVGRLMKAADLVRVVPVSDDVFELRIGADGGTVVRMEVQGAAPHRLARVAIDGR